MDCRALHQFGDFGQTKYYDARDDRGLGEDWQLVQEMLPKDLEESPILGFPLGPKENLRAVEVLIAIVAEVVKSMERRRSWGRLLGQERAARVHLAQIACPELVEVLRKSADVISRSAS